MTRKSDQPIHQCTAKRAITPWLTVGGKLLVYPDYIVHRPNIIERLIFRSLTIERNDITEVTEAPGGFSGMHTGGLAGGELQYLSVGETSVVSSLWFGSRDDYMSY